MRFAARRLALTAILLAVAVGVGAEDVWVAAAAHTPGANGSLWRTDVGVLNTCDFDVTLEIRLRTDTDQFSRSFEILSGRHQIFSDVVAQLTDANAVGSLQILATTDVTVTSRTYNQSNDGTYGQALDGVRLEAGFGVGDEIILQQLREDDVFRTNIGILNMGTTVAVVQIEVYDRNGELVGSFQMAVRPGETVQENRPIRELLHRTDILGGYARVEVDFGFGVYPYASVVDNRTGDPTTITPKSPSACRPDIAVELEAIEGMTVQELATNLPGYRYFSLHYLQPADHDEPDGEQFEQYITLLHRSLDAPMVLNTLGYNNSVGQGRREITYLLESNQLAVEHRFFADSRPASGDWTLLTIEQAAADHHRIVEALKPIYGGAWINTGHSKGGMTAVYHRRFYPDDVDATVAYVAPISFGAPDYRYIDFLANVGTPACNEDLWAVQREALTRRDVMIDLIQSLAGHLTFDLIGGVERGFESIVIEIPFTFWQYSGETYCSRIPGTTASDLALYNFIDDFVGWNYASDAIFEYFESYYYQAHSQLGYPAVARDHIDDLILTDPPDPEEGVLPEGVTATFDPDVMPDIAQWLATEGERVMFIYGEYDPWTGGAFEPGDAVDAHLFVDPGGTHGAYIGSLEPADRAQAEEIVARWAGVTLTKRLAEPPAVDLHPPWRRGLPQSQPESQ